MSARRGWTDIDEQACARGREGRARRPARAHERLEQRPLRRGDPEDRGLALRAVVRGSTTWLTVGVALRLSEEGRHLGLTESSLEVTWGGLSRGTECGTSCGSRGYVRLAGPAASRGWKLEGLGRAEHGKAVAVALRASKQLSRATARPVLHGSSGRDSSGDACGPQAPPKPLPCPPLKWHAPLPGANRTLALLQVPGIVWGPPASEQPGELLKNGRQTPAPTSPC